MVDREFNVVRAAAPIGQRSVVGSGTVAGMAEFVRVFGGLLLACLWPGRRGLLRAAAADDQRERAERNQQGPYQLQLLHEFKLLSTSDASSRRAA